jgi:cell division initiation protein
MDVSARDVHEKQFHDAWRGYNQEEVDDFLDRIAEARNRLERENDALRSRLREVDQMLETSRSTEEMLKKTLVTAQQAAEEAITQAKEKAEHLVGEAEERARRANDELKHRVATAEEEVRRRTAEAERDADTKRRELQTSIDRLEAFEYDIKRRLHTFLEANMKALEHLSGRADSTTAEDVRAVEQVVEEAPTGGSGPASHVRLHATPSQRAAQEQAQQSAAVQVAENEPRFEIVDDTEGFEGDEGPDPRRKARRGIFRRDVKDETWTDE